MGCWHEPGIVRCGVEANAAPKYLGSEGEDGLCVGVRCLPLVGFFAELEALQLLDQSLPVRVLFEDLHCLGIGAQISQGVLPWPAIHPYRLH